MIKAKIQLFLNAGRLAVVPLTLSAFLITAQPSNAQSERVTKLQGARNLVVTVDGKTSYYYMVLSDVPKVMCLKDGTLTIGTDTYDMRSISMRMKNLPRFVLDEDSTTFGGNYTVDHGLLAFRRSMNVGRWNAVVVPFSLTGRQVLDAFGDEAQLASVKGITENGDEATVEFNSIDLDTDDVVLQAGINYLLKPSREPDIDEGKQTSVVYGSAKVKGPVYVIPNVSLPKGKVIPDIQIVNSESKQIRVAFNGTYKLRDGKSKVVPTTKNLFALNDAGQFYQLIDSTTVKAFRSWIRDASQLENVKFRFVVDGIGFDDKADIGATTGIAEIERMRNEDNEIIYDLQGRRLSKSQISSLRPQLVIINGKKVIIR